MKILIFSILIVACHTLFAQENWTFEQSVDFDRYTSYKGSINDKYPITMYLKESYESCDKNFSRWKPRKVYGWYMYDKIGKRIPLIGHVCYADGCESLLELFVPEDPVNYSFDENCDLPNAKEIFRQEHGWDANTFEWQMKNGQKYPVKLKPIHEFIWTTRAKIILKINELEIETFDLNKLAENEYIENIELLGEKRVGNKFHLLLKYSHQSNPGSYGFGMCGAGIEEFIAHLVVDEEFNVESFDTIQSHSCINSLDIDVHFDANNPELGIRKEN